MNSEGPAGRAQFGSSDLWYEVADPEDDSIESLDLGEGPGVAHVRDFFASRAWTGIGSFDPSTCLKLTTQAGNVVGYCAVVEMATGYPTSKSRSKETSLALLQLCIVPEFRRVDHSVEPPRSYAKLAMELVEATAMQRGCRAVVLAAEAANTDAIEFYGRIGYEPDGIYYSKRYETEMHRFRQNFDD